MEAIELDPSSAYAHGLCGHNLLKLGQLKAARSFLERSLELDPQSHAVHFSMGMLFLAEGDEARSKSSFAMAEAVRTEAASSMPPVVGIELISAADNSLILLEESPEEILLLRAKYAPPFSRFRGRGCRMSSNPSPLQMVAMALAFPLFYGTSTIKAVDQSSVEPWPTNVPFAGDFGRRLQHKLQQRRFVRRRYSGDTHAPLARSRYMALAGEGHAQPSYTLLAEINAYTVTQKSGYCAAVLGPDGQSIQLVFRGLPGEPNPLYRLVSDPSQFSSLFAKTTSDPRQLITPEIRDAISSDTIVAVPFPHEEVDVELDNAFDLRLPETRRWMVEFFRNPPPCETDEDLAHGAMLREMACRYSFDLSAVHEWRGLLPVTNGMTFGGNGMTDLFATFLRKVGCDGLIYPSARCDHGVIVDDGAPVYDWGWNVVDYRGAEAPERISMEEISPLEGLHGIRHFAEIPDGDHEGSFAYLGNSLYQLVENQRTFDEYCLLHGPEWRVKRNARELTVRGYSWFRRTYSLEFDSVDFVTCDQCQSRCPAERAFLPRCPNCQFAGDLGVYVQVPDLLAERLEPM
jgi:hypothetical protein